jgi:hypothetical protein
MEISKHHDKRPAIKEISELYHVPCVVLQRDLPGELASWSLFVSNSGEIRRWCRTGLLRRCEEVQERHQQKKK